LFIFLLARPLMFLSSMFMYFSQQLLYSVDGFLVNDPSANGMAAGANLLGFTGSFANKVACSVWRQYWYNGHCYNAKGFHCVSKTPAGVYNGTTDSCTG